MLASGLGGGKSKKPKEPKKTAEQQALEKRQRSMLDKEIGEQEELLKMIARGRLGKRSLLKGAGANPSRQATGGSILGAGGSGSGGGAGRGGIGSSGGMATK